MSSISLAHKTDKQGKPKDQLKFIPLASYLCADLLAETMTKRKEEEAETTSTPNGAKKPKTDVDASATTVLSDPENALLANLMAYHMREVNGASFEKCAADLGFMKRTKSWCKAWSQLIDKGLIISCVPGGAKTTADHCLTDAGKAQASTPEYEEFVKDKTFVAATNEDHQDRIKKRLVNEKSRQRGIQIFDLLLEHGALTRKELCGIIGVRSGTHSFSYALKELKGKQLVVGQGPEKLRLSDKAFLDPSTDRPSNESDQDTIKELMSKSKYADEIKEGKAKKSKNKKTKDKSTTSDDENDPEKDSTKCIKADAGKSRQTSGKDLNEENQDEENDNEEDAGGNIDDVTVPVSDQE